jgi:hypothetical protein
MIKVNVRVSKGFYNKIATLNRVVGELGKETAAGFPADKVEERIIVRARAINHRYLNKDIPWNWYPRYERPNVYLPGVAEVGGAAYQGWAFMERAAEIFAQKERDELLRRWFSALMLGRARDSIHDRIGKKLVERIKAEIRKTTYPPLARSTVRRKGHSRLLIETGEMLDSVTYSVRRT